jgi:hypothetical protein
MIRIREEQPGPYFREIRNHFSGSGMEKSESGIRDGKKFGSGINIPDPQHFLFLDLTSL